VDFVTKKVSTFAGTSVEYPAVGGLATTSNIGNPSAMAKDTRGNIYFTSVLSNPNKASLVMKIGTNGILNIIAGSNRIDPSQVLKPFGDGSAAMSALLYDATTLAVDSSGDLYIGEDNYIRFVSAYAFTSPTPQPSRIPQNTIWNFAGDGSAGYTNDGGLVASARY